METKRPVDKGMLIGAVLVGIGVLFLLQTVGVINFMWRTTFAVAFLGGAAAFLSVFINDNRQWWSVFPAAGLGFVGMTILFPSGSMAGMLLFLLMGTAFLAVYAVRREWVWPIIPAGVMYTLAAVILFNDVTHLGRFFDGGAIFFFGLALTFLAVWYLAPLRRAYNWALIPAAVLGGLGMLIAIGSAMKFIIPIGLILIGVYALTNDRSGHHNR
jgi:hypothetical protein